MRVFGIIIFTCIVITTISLKIYKSNVKFPNRKLISGLVYKKDVSQFKFLSNNFTVCIRVSLKTSAQDKSAMFLLIGHSKSKAFLTLYARYPETWFHFGNQNRISWILRDPEIYIYRIWKLDTWNHICFSYSESNSYIGLIKVIKKKPKKKTY